MTIEVRPFCFFAVTFQITQYMIEQEYSQGEYDLIVSSNNCHYHRISLFMMHYSVAGLSLIHI